MSQPVTSSATIEPALPPMIVNGYCQYSPRMYIVHGLLIVSRTSRRIAVEAHALPTMSK